MTDYSSVHLVALLLKRLAREMEGLSAEDLAAIVHDRAPILTKKSPAAAERKHEAFAHHAIDTEALLQRLRDLSDRDAGAQLLQREATTRADLVKLAKAVDVPVVKRHTVGQIVEKIVEATIGFRTRSAAIRGETAG